MSSMISAKLSTAKNTLISRDSKISKTIGYYGTFVVFGMLMASLGPTLPGLTENTQSQLSQISYLFTARSLGYLLGSLYVGRWYDRVAGHHVLVSALLLIGGMAFLVPLIPLLWLLVVVMLFMGIGEGGIDVGPNTLLIWLYQDKVGPYMNGLHFFYGIGAFMSPLIIAWVILVSGDITWGYWILALLVIPVALWVIRLPSPERVRKDEDSQTGRVNYVLVILVAAFLFLLVGAEGGYAGWIYTFAVSQLNLSGVGAAAYLNSAFWGALTAGRLLSIPLATRVRPRTILLVDLIGCLVSMAVVFLWTDSILAVWIGTLGFGLFMASTFPTTLILAERRMPVTGQITGYFFVGVGAGAMFVPWLIGQLFESVGPQVLVYILLVDLLLAVGVYISLIFTSTRSSDIYASDG